MRFIVLRKEKNKRENGGALEMSNNSSYITEMLEQIAGGNTNTESPKEEKATMTTLDMSNNNQGTCSVVHDSSVGNTPVVSIPTIASPMVDPISTYNAPTVGVVAAPTVETPIQNETKEVVVKKKATVSKSSKKTIDKDAIAADLVANFANMDKMAIHNALLDIMGKSSSGITKSLGLMPGNLILNSIRGLRQLNEKALRLVVDAFKNDPSIASRPQILALITDDLFLNPKVKEEVSKKESDGDVASN